MFNYLSSLFFGVFHKRINKVGKVRYKSKKKNILNAQKNQKKTSIMSTNTAVISMLIFLVVVAGMAVLWKMGKMIKSKFFSSCGINGAHHHHSACGAPTDCEGAPADAAMSDTPYAGGLGLSVAVGGSQDHESAAVVGGTEDHIHQYNYVY